MNKVSDKAANLIGSEILQLGQQISRLTASGHSIYNLTIGDFDPKIFPIPDALKANIVESYQNNETNYPPADGVAVLKKSVQHFLETFQGLKVADNELLIAAGGRPLIYAAYKSIVNPGESVVYPTPSWNNNHYCYLADAVGVEVITKPENGFLPTADELKDHVGNAAMLALCSPLNPTGTTFTRKQLEEICDLVLEENAKRAGTRKPLYMLYDQIYWMLRADGIEHVDPVSVRPEMKEYTVYVDGISKAFAATGVRVGWSVGPESVIGVMKTILVHVGAWAPRAEQVATAKFLRDETALRSYMTELQTKIDTRFDLLYNGIQALRAKGLPVQAIRPQGAIYVSAQFYIIGKKKPDGSVIADTKDITDYLIDSAATAAVPFTAFGCAAGTDWYRISVGTLQEDQVTKLLGALEIALNQLV